MTLNYASVPKPPIGAPSWAATLVHDIVSWVESIRRGPQGLTVYVKAKLPDATKNRGALIAVLDDVGGFTPAYSDATNWRRTADNAVIS